MPAPSTAVCVSSPSTWTRSRRRARPCSPAPMRSGSTTPMVSRSTSLRTYFADAGMTADTEEFDRLMTEQRERARAARGEISGWTGLDLGLEGDPTVFTGYDTLEDKGTVEALIAAGELSGELGEGTEGSIRARQDPILRRDGRPGGRHRHYY